MRIIIVSLLPVQYGARKTPRIPLNFSEPFPSDLFRLQSYSLQN